MDPTPLSKCKVAANSHNPLVTEWPASEKAHLESMAASQTIAVQYLGCELRIVDGCRLPGQYMWRRTTLATDTIEIADADELYAKIPIGAVGLEGELARSGRLAVQTTVGGQLRSEGMDVVDPDSAACSEATHYITAISVGSFQLLSGSDTKGGGRVGLGSVGAGSKASHKEVVLREAGSRQACTEATDEAPHGQCASPIQLFLAPLSPKAVVARSQTTEPSPEEQMRATGVNLALPPPEDEDEIWTLRRPGGKVVCTLPCDAWVGPVSGYYLQREPRNGVSQAMLHLPQAFAHPVGSRISAEYQARRGNPELSKWAFYLGAIPMGMMGVGFTTWGIVQAASTCEDALGAEEECFPGPGFLLTYGIINLAFAGAGTWWYLWSREETFNTYEQLAISAPPKPSTVKVMLGPGAIVGTF
jgi:hypothetical protein